MEPGIKVHFREVQRFRQAWLWLLLVLMAVCVAAPFGYGIFKQFLLGEPWGDRAMSDTGLAVAATVATLFVAGLTYLFYKLEMITEVRDDSLYVRFFPFVKQEIPFDTIKSCEVRVYRPIREYGGWGIRYGWKGRAYNVSGNVGVQLELTDGKRLLVGSQQSEQLAHAIRSRMRSGTSR